MSELSCTANNSFVTGKQPRLTMIYTRASHLRLMQSKFASIYVHSSPEPFNICLFRALCFRCW